MGTITIKGDAESRQQNTKNGPRTVHYQPASLETNNIRMRYDFELKNPNQPYAVGTVLDWDVENDIQAGKYGPELARNLTVTLRKQAAPRVA